MFILVSIAVAAADAAILATPVDHQSCPHVTGEQVIVCGDRNQRSPYRIDPVIGAMSRQQEPSVASPPEHRRIDQEACPPHGLKTCKGLDTIPILAIARVAAKSAMLAMDGEDWREPLRTQDDQYEVYREAKAREARRRDDRRPRFGIFSGR